MVNGLVMLSTHESTIRSGARVRCGILDGRVRSQNPTVFILSIMLVVVQVRLNEVLVEITSSNPAPIGIYRLACLGIKILSSKPRVWFVRFWLWIQEVQNCLLVEVAILRVTGKVI